MRQQFFFYILVFWIYLLDASASFRLYPPTAPIVICTKKGVHVSLPVELLHQHMSRRSSFSVDNKVNNSCQLADARPSCRSQDECTTACHESHAATLTRYRRVCVAFLRKSVEADSEKLVSFVAWKNCPSTSISRLKRSSSRTVLYKRVTFIPPTPLPSVQVVCRCIHSRLRKPCTSNVFVGDANDVLTASLGSYPSSMKGSFGIEFLASNVDETLVDMTYEGINSSKSLIVDTAKEMLSRRMGADILDISDMDAEETSLSIDRDFQTTDNDASFSLFQVVREALQSRRLTFKTETIGLRNRYSIPRSCKLIFQGVGQSVLQPVEKQSDNLGSDNEIVVLEEGCAINPLWDYKLDGSEEIGIETPGLTQFESLMSINVTNNNTTHAHESISIEENVLIKSRVLYFSFSFAGLIPFLNADLKESFELKQEREKDIQSIVTTSLKCSMELHPGVPQLEKLCPEVSSVRVPATPLPNYLNHVENEISKKQGSLTSSTRLNVSRNDMSYNDSDDIEVESFLNELHSFGVSMKQTSQESLHDLREPTYDEETERWQKYRVPRSRSFRYLSSHERSRNNETPPPLKNNYRTDREAEMQMTLSPENKKNHLKRYEVLNARSRNIFMDQLGHHFESAIADVETKNEYLCVPNIEMNESSKLDGSLVTVNYECNDKPFLAPKEVNDDPEIFSIESQIETEIEKILEDEFQGRNNSQVQGSNHLESAAADSTNAVTSNLQLKHLRNEASNKFYRRRHRTASRQLSLLHQSKTTSVSEGLCHLHTRSKSHNSPHFVLLPIQTTRQLTPAYQLSLSHKSSHRLQTEVKWSKICTEMSLDESENEISDRMTSVPDVSIINKNHRQLGEATEAALESPYFSFRPYLLNPNLEEIEKQELDIWHEEHEMQRLIEQEKVRSIENDGEIPATNQSGQKFAEIAQIMTPADADVNERTVLQKSNDPAVVNRGALGLGIGKDVPKSATSVYKAVNLVSYGPWMVQWARDKNERTTDIQIGNGLGFVEAGVGAVQREVSFNTGWRNLVFAYSSSENRQEASTSLALGSYGIHVDRSQSQQATAIEIIARGFQSGTLVDFVNMNFGQRFQIRNFEISIRHDFDDYFLPFNPGFGTDLMISYKGVTAAIANDLSGKRLGVTIGIRGYDVALLHDFDNFLTVGQANWGLGWQLALESDYPDEYSSSTFLSVGMGRLDRIFGQIGAGIGEDGVPQATARLQTRNVGVTADFIDEFGQRLFQYAITIGRFSYVWQMNLDLTNLRLPKLLGTDPLLLEKFFLSFLPKKRVLD